MAETTLLKTDAMSVSAINGTADDYDSKRWRKLDQDATIEVLGLLRALPAAATASTLGQSYAVYFPKGLPGELLRRKDGFYQLTKVDEAHHFVENGVLADMKAETLAYSVFQVLSIATQQYYLHEINQQLRDLNAKLDQVLDFLYTDKACELYAEAQAIQSIYQNYASIMRHPEQRLSALQSIQRAKVLAERNAQFYMRDIRRLVEHIDKETRSLRDDLNSYTQTLRLYGICAALEIMLTQNFDESYLAWVEKDLKAHYDQHNINISNLRGFVDAAVKAMKAGKPAILGIAIGGGGVPAEVIQLQKEIDDVLGEQSPVRGFEDTVRSIQKTFSAPTEFRITAEGTVYQKAANG